MSYARLRERIRRLANPTVALLLVLTQIARPFGTAPQPQRAFDRLRAHVLPIVEVF